MTTATQHSVSSLEQLARSYKVDWADVIVADNGSGSLRLARFAGGRFVGDIVRIPHSQGIPIYRSVENFVGDARPDLIVFGSTGCVEDGVVVPTNGQRSPISEEGLSLAGRFTAATILNDAEIAAYHTLWMPWEGNVRVIWPTGGEPDPGGDKLHVVGGGGLGACRRAAGTNLVRATEMGHPKPLSNNPNDDMFIHQFLDANGFRPSTELAGAGGIGLCTAYRALQGWSSYDPQKDYQPRLVLDIYRMARESYSVAVRAVLKQVRELGAWLGTQALANFSGGIVIDSDAVLGQLDLLLALGLLAEIEAAIGVEGSNSRKMALRTPIGVITSKEEMGLLGGVRYALLRLAGEL